MFINDRHKCEFIEKDKVMDFAGGQGVCMYVCMYVWGAL